MLFFKHQFDAMGGRCGICGDAYDAHPRQHEAPGGNYANGIIVKQYKAGKKIFKGGLVKTYCNSSVNFLYYLKQWN